MRVGLTWGQRLMLQRPVVASLILSTIFFAVTFLADVIIDRGMTPTMFWLLFGGSYLLVGPVQALRARARMRRLGYESHL